MLILRTPFRNTEAERADFLAIKNILPAKAKSVIQVNKARRSRASNSNNRGPLVINEGIPEVDEDEHWMWVARVLRRSDE